MVIGHHGAGDGRGSTAALRHASHARAFPHPAESTAQAQIQKMEPKVLLFRAKLPH